MEKVTILVPVYNEATVIAHFCKDVQGTLSRSPYEFEILLLDDGSTDWSEEVNASLVETDNLEVRHCGENRGKGAVLNDAFPLLDSDLAVVIDADGEYDPNDILLLLDALTAGQADWVMGTRYGFGRKRPDQYYFTYLVNRFLSATFSLLSGVHMNDMLTGIFAFRSSVVKRIRLHEKRFSYTPELLWKALHHNSARMMEIPVSYRYRTYGEGKKIRWWETATILSSIIRYRFRNARS